MSMMMMMMTGSHARRNVYARQFYAAFKKICGPHKHQICSGNVVDNCLKPELPHLVQQGSKHMDSAILATRRSR